MELSVVGVLLLHPWLKIKSKMFFCLSSLYKNLVFLSNLVQSSLTILGTCSKILFKKSILGQFLSALFSSSKSFSFSVQKYFSILHPLSVLYSSISLKDKCPNGRETTEFGKYKGLSLSCENLLFLILWVVISPFLTEILPTSLTSAFGFL